MLVVIYGVWNCKPRLREVFYQGYNTWYGTECFVPDIEDAKHFDSVDAAEQHWETVKGLFVSQDLLTEVVEVVC